MKTKNYNLEENIKKALRKAKKELQGYSWDWHAKIVVYDNGAVTMNRDMNAGTNGEIIHKFGEVEGAELVETFKMRDHQEIKVNEDAEYILGMLGGLSKEENVEVPKSIYAGMSDVEIKENIESAHIERMATDIVDIYHEGGKKSLIIRDFFELIGYDLTRFKTIQAK